MSQIPVPDNHSLVVYVTCGWIPIFDTQNFFHSKFIDCLASAILLLLPFISYHNFYKFLFIQLSNSLLVLPPTPPGPLNVVKAVMDPEGGVHPPKITLKCDKAQATLKNRSKSREPNTGCQVPMALEKIGK